MTTLLTTLPGDIPHNCHTCARDLRGSVYGALCRLDRGGEVRLCRVPRAWLHAAGGDGNWRWPRLSLVTADGCPEWVAPEPDGGRS